MAAMNPRVRTALVWFGVTLAALIAGWAWALSSPIGSGPDDDFHMPSIWCPMPLDTSGCTVDHRPDGSVVVMAPEQAVAASICFAFHPERSGACTGALSSEKLVPTNRINNGDYPPLYYQVMHKFVGKSVMTSVIVMRMFNVAVAVGMGLLMAWGVTAASRRALGWAILGTCIPLGVFMMASVNPTAWWLPGVAGFAVAFDGLIRSPDLKRRLINAVTLSLGAFLACFSRADGGLMVVLTAGAVAILNLRPLLRRVDAMVLGAAACAVGAWQTLAAGQAARAGGQGLGQTVSQGAQNLTISNILDLPRLWWGIYAIPGWGLGWLDTAIPSVAWGTLLILCAMLVSVGVKNATGRQRLVAGLLLSACAVMPVYLLRASATVVGTNYQPRYLLPLFVVMFYLLLRPEVETTRRLFPPTTTVWLFLGVALAHTLALMYNLRRYVWGIDGPLIPLGSVPWWWTRTGPGPAWVLLLGTVGIVVTSLLGTGAQVVIPAPRHWPSLLAARWAARSAPASAQSKDTIRDA